MGKYRNKRLESDFRRVEELFRLMDHQPKVSGEVMEKVVKKFSHEQRLLSRLDFRRGEGIKKKRFQFSKNFHIFITTALDISFNNKYNLDCIVIVAFQN